MKFLDKLLIASLLFFLQIGISCISQGDAAPIGLSFIITFAYGFWCENYLLAFISGILSWASFFMAVGLWCYVIQDVPLWDTLRPAFTAPWFYLWALLFGVIGILSVKLKYWLKQRDANRKLLKM